jgi:hypothetical protein
LREENQQLREVKEKTVTIETEAVKKCKTHYKCFKSKLSMVFTAQSITIVPDEVKDLQAKLDAADSIHASLKQELAEYAEEANRIQNGQQNQLQGCQAVS